MAAPERDQEALVSRQERALEIQKKLTCRELECLRLRAEGLSYAEIGSVLGIRCGTVGALLARLHDKLRWPPGREGTIGWEPPKPYAFCSWEVPTCAIPTPNR